MHITFGSKIAQSEQYRPDVDGLRGIAVLAVVLYHAKVSGVSGGFVGVDIFFVISGYLITSIISKELNLGRFSIVSFYERRMRRIFPALFVVLFFSIAAASVLFAPHDLMFFGKSMVATTCFISNIFFIRYSGNANYFNDSSYQPLLHTWSLSVEEQFYLLFPATLAVLTWRMKGKTRQVLILLAAASLFWSIFLVHRSPTPAFYSILPRAWELLAGSLLALRVVPALHSRLLRELTGLAGIGLIAFAVTRFTTQTAFPGLNALFPCCGAALILYTGEAGPSSTRSVLSFPPLVFIGVISYSLYLWHWPLLIFSKYFCAGDLSSIETAAVVIGSIILAFLSFEFVESPFRGRNSIFTRRQIFSLGLTTSGTAIVLGLAIVATHGVPQRYGPPIRQLVLANQARETEFLNVCENWRQEVHSLADVNFCYLGLNQPRKIMFWGDSHVQQLYPLITKLYASGALANHGVVIGVDPGCPPTEHMNFADGLSHCDSYARLAMTRAELSDIDTVFIGFNTWWSFHKNGICPSIDGRCVSMPSLEESRKLFLLDLSSEIRELRGHGKRVIVSLPFPMYDKAIPALEIRNALFGRFGLKGAATDETLPGFREEVAAVVQQAGAEAFDPRKTLCNGQHCITEVGGVSIYIDSHHIAASQVGILEEDLKQTLQPVATAGNVTRSQSVAE